MEIFFKKTKKVQHTRLDIDFHKIFQNSGHLLFKTTLFSLEIIPHSNISISGV